MYEKIYWLVYQFRLDFDTPQPIIVVISPINKFIIFKLLTLPLLRKSYELEIFKSLVEKVLPIDRIPARMTFAALVLDTAAKQISATLFPVIPTTFRSVKIRK